MIDCIPARVGNNLLNNYAILMVILSREIFLSEELVTLPEEQALPSNLLNSSCQFRLTVSELDKPFKNLTKLSRNFLEPFGFKCNR